jgi:hypothetical protein
MLSLIDPRIVNLLSKVSKGFRHGDAHGNLSGSPPSLDYAAKPRKAK